MAGFRLTAAEADVPSTAKTEAFGGMSAVRLTPKLGHAGPGYANGQFF